MAQPEENMTTVLIVLLVIWLSVQLAPVLFGIAAVCLFAAADLLDWIERKSKK